MASVTTVRGSTNPSRSFSTRNWTLSSQRLSVCMASSKAPGPSEQGHADNENDRAENRVASMSAHPRTVHHVRTLQYPHDSGDDQDHPDDSANPHLVLLTW